MEWYKNGDCETEATNWEEEGFHCRHNKLIEHNEIQQTWLTIE